MKTWFAQKLYFGLQSARGEPIKQALLDVRATEFYSRDQLFALQARRQLEQLRYAVEHVKYYREMRFLHSLQRNGDWSYVNQVMNSMPILSRDRVRESKSDFLSDEAKKLKTFPDKTSGSSGTPLTFPCDQRAWAYRHAINYRAMEAFDVQIGEPYIFFYGLHWNKLSKMQVQLRDILLNRIRVSAYHIEKKLIIEQYKQIKSIKPTHFIGYPSAIYDFCILLRDEGLDFRGTKLKAIFLTSEPLLSYQRQLIEDVTGTGCVNIYGSAEGGATAFECPAGSMHSAVEVNWLQLEDPSCSKGDALLTDMMLRAFPMIKYSIGDEVELQAGECSCGRKHPMLKAIQGRSGDPITLPNGKKINSHLPGYIFKPLGEKGVIRRFRFVQDASNNLCLFLVVSNSFTPTDMHTIYHEIGKAFGNDIKCDIQIVDSLPTLPNAKHRSYIQLPPSSIN